MAYVSYSKREKTANGASHGRRRLPELSSELQSIVPPALQS